MVEVNRKTTGHYERNPYAARLATILASMVTPHSWLSPTPSSNPKLSNRHFLPVDMGDCHASRTGTATLHACNLARFNRYGQAFSIRHPFRVAQNNFFGTLYNGKDQVATASQLSRNEAKPCHPRYLVGLATWTPARTIRTGLSPTPCYNTPFPWPPCSDI